MKRERESNPLKWSDLFGADSVHRDGGSEDGCCGGRLTVKTMKFQIQGPSLPQSLARPRDLAKCLHNQIFFKPLQN